MNFKCSCGRTYCPDCLSQCPRCGKDEYHAGGCNCFCHDQKGAHWAEQGWTRFGCGCMYRQSNPPHGGTINFTYCRRHSSNVALVEALKGALEIAEMAMPDSFFQTDRRVKAAQEAIEAAS